MGVAQPRPHLQPPPESGSPGPPPMSTSLGCFTAMAFWSTATIRSQRPGREWPSPHLSGGRRWRAGVWLCHHAEMSPTPRPAQGCWPQSFSVQTKRQKGGESISPWGRGWTAGPGLDSSAQGDTP